MYTFESYQILMFGFATESVCKQWWRIQKYNHICMYLEDTQNVDVYILTSEAWFFIFHIS